MILLLLAKFNVLNYIWIRNPETVAFGLLSSGNITYQECTDKCGDYFGLPSDKGSTNSYVFQEISFGRLREFRIQRFLIIIKRRSRCLRGHQKFLLKILIMLTPNIILTIWLGIPGQFSTNDLGLIWGPL